MVTDNTLEYQDVWQQAPDPWHDEVLAFWRSMQVLPSEEEGQERLKQLCFLARDNGRLIGLSTAHAAMIDHLRSRFLFFRCAVDPAYRQREVARALTVKTRDMLQDWCAGHVEEKIQGMATVVESPLLRGLAQKPVWEASGLTMIGYTQNNLQVRIVWFEHARLEV